MDDDSPAPETQLISFVVRFVCDAPPNALQPATDWRGLVRHVQSDRELHFTRWEEAVAFMAQYVNVEHAAPGNSQGL